MTSTDVEPEVKRIAKHELLDASGQVVETPEEAQGYRYTLLANGKTRDYIYGQHQHADRMLALFGARTLATNETSQVRNNPKGDAGADAQSAAVEERFAMLENDAEPTWMDRTREPTVGAINKDALANAISAYLQGIGKPITDAQRVSLRQKVEEDKAYVRSMRSHPRISALYAEAVGKPQVTDDQVMAGVA